MPSWQLYQLCVAINRQPDIATILRAAQSSTGADVAYLKVKGPDGLFRIGEHVGLRRDVFRDHLMHSDQGLGGYALRAGIVTCGDYFDDGRFVHAFDEVVATEGLRAMVVAPLPYRDGVLGLLYVGWREPTRLDTFDVWRYGVLATHAALVLGTIAESGALASEAETTAGDKDGRGSGAYRLTRRQLQIIRLRSLGLTVSEIADTLGISEHTVRFHLRRLMVRLQCHSEVALIAKAFRAGILT